MILLLMPLVSLGVMVDTFWFVFFFDCVFDFFVVMCEEHWF